MPGSRFTAATWATMALRSSGSSRFAFSGRLRVSVATGCAMSSDGRLAMSLLTAQLTESRAFLSPLDRRFNCETEFVLPGFEVVGVQGLVDATPAIGLKH